MLPLPMLLPPLRAKSSYKLHLMRMLMFPALPLGAGGRGMEPGPVRDDAVPPPGGLRERLHQQRGGDEVVVEVEPADYHAALAAAAAAAAVVCYGSNYANTGITALPTALCTSTARTLAPPPPQNGTQESVACGIGRGTS